MAIELKQSLKLSQQLLITPQLQQAIKLLQLSRIELVETVQKELLENPVLEESPEQERPEGETPLPNENLSDQNSSNASVEGSLNSAQDANHRTDENADFDWANYVESYNSFHRDGRAGTSLDDVPNYENMMTKAATLTDHLEWQLAMQSLTTEELDTCMTLIGNLDENGYLPISLNELAEKTQHSFDELEDALCIIQELDPLGVGARDLKECLLLQVKVCEPADRKLLANCIAEHLPLIEKRDYPTLAKKLGIPMKRVMDIATVIRNLEPKPGRPFGGQSTQYVTPDVYIRKIGDEYMVVLNEDGLPKLQISNFYKDAIRREMHSAKIAKNEAEAQAQNYIQEKLKSALWLIKSIHQRQKTLYKVTKCIAEFQKEFLDTDVGQLKPLILRDIAEKIGVHESTVSRATNGKFVHTPQGIFELRYFFNTGLGNAAGGEDFANETVKQMVRQIIGGENNKAPLSDQAIAVILKNQSINIARRTVAKYREILGIQPSSRRRQHF
jgi:RNA polymerase sigma-54 factor